MSAASVPGPLGGELPPFTPRTNARTKDFFVQKMLDITAIATQMREKSNQISTMRNISTETCASVPPGMINDARVQTTIQNSSRILSGMEQIMQQARESLALTIRDFQTFTRANYNRLSAKEREEVFLTKQLIDTQNLFPFILPSTENSPQQQNPEETASSA